jgi:hypothetical protein
MTIECDKFNFVGLVVFVNVNYGAYVTGFKSFGRD